jgi:hypothetical protein
MRHRHLLLSPQQFVLLVALLATLPLGDIAAAQSPAAKLIGEDSHTPQLPQNDAIRIHEFYRLAPQIADDVWPGWSRTIAPLLLVTS